MSVDPKSTYYDHGGIETIKIIKAKLTREQFRGYLLGSCIKYACRLNFKGQSERDAEKIHIYSGMLGGEMEDKRKQPGRRVTLRDRRDHGYSSYIKVRLPDRRVANRRQGPRRDKTRKEG